MNKTFQPQSRRKKAYSKLGCINQQCIPNWYAITIEISVQLLSHTLTLIRLIYLWFIIYLATFSRQSPSWGALIRDTYYARYFYVICLHSGENVQPGGNMGSKLTN